MTKRVIWVELTFDIRMREKKTSQRILCIRLLRWRCKILFRSGVGSNQKEFASVYIYVLKIRREFLVCNQISFSSY
jgi:hypothetical protein